MWRLPCFYPSSGLSRAEMSRSWGNNFRSKKGYLIMFYTSRMLGLKCLGLYQGVGYQIFTTEHDMLVFKFLTLINASRSRSHLASWSFAVSGR